MLVLLSRIYRLYFNKYFYNKRNKRVYITRIYNRFQLSANDKELLFEVNRVFLLRRRLVRITRRNLILDNKEYTILARLKARYNVINKIIIIY